MSFAHSAGGPPRGSSDECKPPQDTLVPTREGCMVDSDARMPKTHYNYTYVLNADQPPAAAAMIPALIAAGRNPASRELIT